MNTTPATQFETLIGEHRKIIGSICNAYCRDRVEREDLAQEIAIQVWRSFSTFDGRSRFATWLYRVALNVAISHRRRDGRRPRQAPLTERVLEIPEPVVQEPENRRRLRDFIARLDPLDAALALLYLEEHPYREIAEILGISETNVATKLSRLKARMKMHFAGATA